MLAILTAYSEKGRVKLREGKYYLNPPELVWQKCLQNYGLEAGLPSIQNIKCGRSCLPPEIAYILWGQYCMPMCQYF